MICGLSRSADISLIADPSRFMFRPVAKEPVYKLVIELAQRVPVQIDGAHIGMCDFVYGVAAGEHSRAVPVRGGMKSLIICSTRTRSPPETSSRPSSMIRNPPRARARRRKPLGPRETIAAQLLSKKILQWPSRSLAAVEFQQNGDDPLGMAALGLAQLSMEIAQQHRLACSRRAGYHNMRIAPHEVDGVEGSRRPPERDDAHRYIDIMDIDNVIVKKASGSLA